MDGRIRKKKSLGWLPGFSQELIKNCWKLGNVPHPAGSSTIVHISNIISHYYNKTHKNILRHSKSKIYL